MADFADTPTAALGVELAPVSPGAAWWQRCPPLTGGTGLERDDEPVRAPHPRGLAHADLRVAQLDGASFVAATSNTCSWQKPI